MTTQCFQHKHGSREAALAMTRLDVAQHTTVNIAVKDGKIFTYSIGLLEHFDHPEIIITGLRTELAHIFLNTLRDEIKDGRSFETELIYTDLAVGDLPLIFKPVSEDHFAEYLGYGFDYYRTYEPEKAKRFAAWQMVWSDKAGLFPWQKNYGFPPQAQPLLFERPEVSDVRL